MNIRKITSTLEFAGLEEPWNRLANSPFKSFDWLYSWWVNFGENRRLAIYLLEDGNEIVGIAPFYEAPWLGQSRLRYLASGSICSDYADLIVRPENRSLFAALLSEQLVKEYSMIELEGTNGEGFESESNLAFEKSCWRYQRDLQPTWHLSLPETWKEFYAGSKKSLKRKIKKAEKRLGTGEVQVESTGDGFDFNMAFENLVELHQERFISKGLPGVFSDSRFYDFLKTASRKLCAKGLAEINVGFVGERSIASQVYFIGERGPMLYQAGVRPNDMKLEPGHLMLTFAVQRIISKGYRHFDFLRGNEAYKPYWGARPQPLYNVRFVSNRWVPSLLNRSFSVLRSIKHFSSGLLTSKN